METTLSQLTNLVNLYLHCDKQLSIVYDERRRVKQQIIQAFREGNMNFYVTPDNILVTVDRLGSVIITEQPKGGE